MCADNPGSLWVGTENGLNWYDANRDKFLRFQYDPLDSSSLSNSYILSLYNDQKNTLWIGTKGGGLNSVDSTAVFKRFYNPFSAESNHINCIIEDRQNSNNLWLGTEDGLFRFDKVTGSFIHVPIGNTALQSCCSCPLSG